MGSGWIIPVGFAAAVGVMGLAGYLMAKKRREELARVALRLGFSFTPADPSFVFNLGQGLSLFSHGHARRANNLMRQEESARRLYVFDYKYSTGSGKNRHTRSQTVFLVKRADFALPSFSLGPENILHGFVELLGMQDINFDSSPGFSKRYFLQGSDETAVRALFTGQSLSFFENHPGWNVEGQGDALLVYRPRKCVAPGDMPRFIEDCRAIESLFER